MKLLRGILLLALGAFPMAEAVSNEFPAPGVEPRGMAYDGTFLYVYNAVGFRKIFRLDPSDGTVLGFFFSGISIGSLEFAGVDRLFHTEYGFALPPNGPGPYVREIALDEPDETAHTTSNQFSVPFRVHAVAFDGTNLYLHDVDSDMFIVTDRAGNVLQNLTTGLRISDMVFDPTTGNI